MAKSIDLNYITKIEGHAKLSIKTEGDEVTSVNLEVVEGARFFEGLVKGLTIKRTPIVTSRICGVCSQSHLIASFLAIENAYGITVSEQTSKLRKLLLYASFIQSHTLHLFFMSLPDYFGYYSAVTMARERPEIIKAALRLKQLSNKILSTISAREIHSITARIGGFRNLPKQEHLDSLLNELKNSYEEIYNLFLTLFPTVTKSNYQSDCDFLSLSGEEYVNLNSNSVVSLSGQTFFIKDYKDHLSEYVKNYSSSKFVKYNAKNFMTSSLSRVNIYRDRLSLNARKLLDRIGLSLPNKCPINNNLCQAAEIIHFYDECIKILEGLKIVPEEPLEIEKLELKSNTGVCAIEVPRGILYHEYKISDSRIIEECNIITPTTQNIGNIEKDIKKFLPSMLDRPKEEIINFIERLIRGYDPCISCSTHFLEVEWDRK